MSLRNTGDECPCRRLVLDGVKRSIRYKIGAPHHRFFCTAETLAPRMLRGWLSQNRKIDQELADLDFNGFAIAHRNPDQFGNVLNGLCWIGGASCAILPAHHPGLPGILQAVAHKIHSCGPALQMAPPLAILR